MVEGLTSEEVEDSVVLLVVRQLRRCASDDDLVRLVITQGLVPHIIRSSNHYTNQLSELSEPSSIHPSQKAAGGASSQFRGDQSPGQHGGHQVRGSYANQRFI